MVILALKVNEEVEMPIDEELPDDLVAQGKALDVRNVIDMQMFDVVPRHGDKKVIDGPWVLRRKGAVTVRARYVTKEIARTKDILAVTPQISSLRCQLAK